MAVKFYIGLKKSKGSGESLIDQGMRFHGNNGHAVILAHGLTGTPNEMRFLANHFYAKGYSVICPRLANHGNPLEVLKYTKWEDFYESVRNAFIEAEKENSLIFVSGLSMGALLALVLAEEFHDRIAGVCCLSPTLFYDGWNVPWYQCFLPLATAIPFLKDSLYFKEDPPYGIKNERVQRIIHRYYSNASLTHMEGVDKHGYPYFPLTLLYQLNLLIRHLDKRLKNIQVPVKLIQAKDDDITSVKNSQFIYDRIKSDIKEITLLYNSYHVITADQERDKVASEMEVFFNRVKDSRLNIKNA